MKYIWKDLLVDDAIVAIVLVGDDEIAKVLSFVGGARDPDAPSLFQVANVDSGEIKFVHGQQVKQILSKRD